MALVSMRELLDHAAANGYGIPAFNVNNLEQVQAVMEAAKEVGGSSLYKIEITIAELPKKQWETLKQACAGQIGSLIELIQGKLSKNILEIITRKGDGLFPKPAEIKMDCSCPDWAGLCKHLAAVLYGVGAKLDTNPELF